MGGYCGAAAGQKVDFMYVPAAEDGYAYRALNVTMEGVPRVEPDQGTWTGVPESSHHQLGLNSTKAPLWGG